MGPFARIVEAIEAEGAAALTTIVRVEGSAPREAGAQMVVRPSGGFHGTIGGGALEFAAIAAAREALASGRRPAERRSLALGPELAQCCGGRVEWRIEVFDRSDLPALAPLAEAEAAGRAKLAARLGADGRIERRLDASEAVARSSAPSPRAEAWTETIGEAARAVYLFGAGHVGRALALALAPLPFAVTWIDQRAEAFPAHAPANARLVRSHDPPAELGRAPDGAFVVVMTHSHPLDLAIVSAALAAARFGYVGLIGSASKRARFVSQMRAAGLAEATLSPLVSPIGVAGIAGKAPALIAAATAAQLLMRDEALAG